jgi:hypothetical protein
MPPRGPKSRETRSRENPLVNKDRLRCTKAMCSSILATAILVALSACADKTISASVRGYSHHIENSIYSFTVNGAMGSPLGTDGGGSASSCCVVLPARWRPGLTATVEVEYSTPQGGPSPPPPRTFEVPVEEYTEQNRGALQVHFYPRGKVRIVVSRYSPGHPKYPPLEDIEPNWDWYRNYCTFDVPSDLVCKTMPMENRQ